MVFVKKRDGTAEEFDQDKLEVSILKARASLTVIGEIVESVAEKMTEGIETKEIRRLVASELRHAGENTAAERYEAFGLIPA